MHKLIKHIIVVLCCLNFTFLPAQNIDQRTTETKIADILMLLPAKNTNQLDQLMADLSEIEQVTQQLSRRLTEPGGTDDSAVRNAISGLAQYAGKGHDKRLRRQIAEDIGMSIYESWNVEIKDFLLIQLQYVATDDLLNSDADTFISELLRSDRLSDATTRVLIRIDSPTSKSILFNALAESKGQAKLNIISALSNYAPAVSTLTSLANGTDPKVQKVVLYALSNIALPNSEKTLYDAAIKAQLMYEPTDALISYVNFLNNRLAQGDYASVEKSAKILIAKAILPQQNAAKCAGLNMYVQCAGERALPEIMKSISGSNKTYRQAALRAAASVGSVKTQTALGSKIKQEKNPEIKAELITSLSSYTSVDAQLLGLIEESLKSKDTAVVISAINTGGKLAGSKMVPQIIKAISNSTNQSVVNAGKQSLLTIAKSDEAVAAVLGSTEPTNTSLSIPAQVAFVEILAHRKALDQVEVVAKRTQIKSGEYQQYEPLITASYKALKDLVQEKDLDRLTALAEPFTPQNKNWNLDQKNALQDALYNAVKKAGNQEQQTALLVKQMNKVQDPSLFYRPLALIGGKDALNKVDQAFLGQQYKPAAFEALTQWSDDAAREVLFGIAKSKDINYADKALMAYVEKVSVSKNTNDQKLLLLRRALELSTTDTQKKEIIKQIGATGVFLAMVTVGPYLDQPNLQQVAAEAVLSVVLKSNRYYGSTVNEYLHKAIAVNKHPEADYHKQAALKYIADHPKEGGYKSIFNGKDLTGWKGLVEQPIARAKMTPAQLAAKQKIADEIMRRDWRVENGILIFEGKGYDNLCSELDYADFNLTLDWRITAGGDAGVYLRGTPQVQIWDTSLIKVGAQVGSGGLYNNSKHTSKPLVVADNGINEWNTFRIQMRGEKVTVYLNGQLVTDKVTLENYWDKKLDIFPSGAIELQAHGERVEWRNIYIMEVPRAEAYQVPIEEQKEGFIPLFNGMDMSGWIGNLTDYFAKDGQIVCDPSKGGKGNLYTDKTYANFVMRFDFQLTPAANNGLGIRTPTTGDAAYVGMELQILDNEAEVYKDLKEYQYHGSVYGVIPAKRSFLKPTGEWNSQEVYINGSKIKVTLNGTVILDGDIATASQPTTLDGLAHPGLTNTTGHIAFLGHGSELAFKNLRIKNLDTVPVTTTKKKRK